MKLVMNPLLTSQTFSLNSYCRPSCSDSGLLEIDRNINVKASKTLEEFPETHTLWFQHQLT